MDIDEFRNAFGNFTQSKQFADIDSDDEKQRQIKLFRESYVRDNPDSNIDDVNDIVERGNKFFLRSTGRGRVMPIDFLKENNIIFPNQEEGYGELTKEQQREKQEEFRAKIPDIAKQNPTQRDDTEYFLNQSLRQVERITNGEDVGWLSDKGKRTAEGFLSTLAKFTGAEDASESIENWFHENPKFDEDLGASLAQGLGSAGSAILIMAGLAATTKGLGGTAGLANAVGTGGMLGANGILRYNEAYKKAIGFGMDEDKATDAAVAALPAAIVDTMADRIIASKLMPKTINSGFLGDEALKRATLRGVMKDNTLKGKLSSYAIAAIGEGSEEAAGDYLAGYLPYLKTGESDFVPSNKELLHSFIVGGILGTGINAAIDLPDFIGNKTLKKTIDGNQIEERFLTKTGRDVAGVKENLPSLDEDISKTVYQLLSEGKYREAYKLSSERITQTEEGLDIPFDDQGDTVDVEAEDVTDTTKTPEPSVAPALKNNIIEDDIIKEADSISNASNQEWLNNPDSAMDPDGSIGYIQAVENIADDVANNFEVHGSTKIAPLPDGKTSSSSASSRALSISKNGVTRGDFGSLKGESIGVANTYTNAPVLVVRNKTTGKEAVVLNSPGAKKQAAILQKAQNPDRPIISYEDLGQWMGDSNTAATPAVTPTSTPAATPATLAPAANTVDIFTDQAKAQAHATVQSKIFGKGKVAVIRNTDNQFEVHANHFGDPRNDGKYIETREKIGQSQTKKAADAIAAKKLEDLKKKLGPLPEETQKKTYAEILDEQSKTGIPAIEFLEQFRQKFKSAKSIRIINQMILDIQKKNPSLRFAMLPDNITAAGAYYENTNTVFVGNASLKDVAHEVAHGLTAADLNTYINNRTETDYREKLAGALQDVNTPQHIKSLIFAYYHAARELEFSDNVGTEVNSEKNIKNAPSREAGAYGFINLDEFLSEAYGSEKFQDLLADIIYQGKSIWEHIVEAIQEALPWIKIFGGDKILRADGENVLTVALVAMNQIVNSDIRVNGGNNINFAPDPDQALYHVTLTSNVPSIIKTGLDRFKPSNWVKAGTGERYGNGEIYSFDSIEDAMKWASNWDWSITSSWGSGELSLVTMKRGKQKWQEDNNDPMSQFGNKGKWLKSEKAVPITQVTNIKPITREVLDEVWNKQKNNINFATMDQVKGFAMATAASLSLSQSTLLDTATNYSKPVKVFPTSHPTVKGEARYELVEPDEEYLKFFKGRPDVSGMAIGAGLNDSPKNSPRQIILNPYTRSGDGSPLSQWQKDLVVKNEAIRHFMDETSLDLNFELTPEQIESFAGTEYGKLEYRQQLKETIVARIITGDESAGNITNEQIKAAQQIETDFNRTSSNVLMTGIEYDGKEYVIPLMVNGVRKSAKEAFAIAKQNGLENYPSFNTIKEANEFAERFHDKIDENGFLKQQKNNINFAPNSYQRESRINELAAVRGSHTKALGLLENAQAAIRSAKNPEAIVSERLKNASKFIGYNLPTNVDEAINIVQTNLDAVITEQDSLVESRKNNINFLPQESTFIKKEINVELKDVSIYLGIAVDRFRHHRTKSGKIWFSDILANLKDSLTENQKIILEKAKAQVDNGEDIESVIEQTFNNLGGSRYEIVGSIIKYNPIIHNDVQDGNGILPNDLVEVVKSGYELGGYTSVEADVVFAKNNINFLPDSLSDSEVFRFIQGQVSHDGTRFTSLGNTDIAISGLVNENRFLSATQMPKQVFELVKQVYPEAWDGKNVNVNKLRELEKTRPLVETHVYGQDGEVTQAKADLDKLTHDWYDNLTQKQQAAVMGYNNNKKYPENQKVIVSENDLDLVTVAQYWNLNDQVISERKVNFPRATSYYNTISPFDTTKYPVVRIDVTVPMRNGENSNYTINERQDGRFELKAFDRGFQDGETFATRQEAQAAIPPKAKWQQDDLHENLPNTLGWAMVQFVPDPRTGETVMFIAEQQSRWGQETDKKKARARKELKDEPNNQRLQDDLKSPHPLLDLQHKLVLKAAMNEARKRGVTKMVVSDGETAMMTERHDTHVNSRNVIATRDKAKAQEALSKARSEDPTGDYRLIPEGEGADILYRVTQYDSEPSQAGGMRQHYDSVLQSAAEKMTRSKGEQVDMGMHKNVNRIGSGESGPAIKSGFQTGEEANNFINSLNGRPGQYQYKRESDGTYIVTEPPFGSPVFRNADGTPKATATGKMYDINPNVVNQIRFAPSPEQDAQYLDAVESGNIEQAQAIVDDAAKAAGREPDSVTYNIKGEVIPLSERFNDKKNNINFAPEQRTNKQQANSYKRLAAIRNGKLNDKHDARTQEIIQLMGSIKATDIPSLPDSLKEYFFDLVDNVYNSRKSGVSSPEARFDSDIVISEIKQIKDAIDAHAIAQMVDAYDTLMTFDELEIDMTDRAEVEKAINEYMEGQKFEDAMAAATRSQKSSERMEKIYEKWRAKFNEIREVIVDRYGDAENYVAETEAMEGTPIYTNELREFLKAHYEYLSSVDAENLTGKDLYDHFFALNNISDGSFNGMGVTINFLSEVRDNNENINKLKNTFQDPVASKTKLLQAADKLNTYVELHHVQLSRLSTIDQTKDWLQNRFMLGLYDAIIRTSNNRKAAYINEYITAKELFEKVIGREVNSEDRILMAIFGRLAQFEIGESPDVALMRNIKKERKSINNIINHGSPDNRKFFRSRVLGLFDQAIEGLEDYGDGSMINFMETFAQRLSGTEDIKVGKERQKLIELTQEIFSRFNTESKIISEGLLGLTFKQQTHYIPNDVLSTDHDESEIDINKPVGQWESNENKAGVKQKSGHYKVRKGDLGGKDYYSYNNENVLSRNVERLAVDSATMVERHIISRRLRKGSELNNIISLDKNGIKHPERVEAIINSAIKLVQNATSRGEPLNYIAKGLRTATSIYAKPVLSSIHHIISQPLSAMIDYGIRNKNVGGWFKAAMFYASNFDKVNQWFEANQKWTADRLATEAMGIDPTRSPIDDTKEDIKNHPLVKSLGKFYEGAGDIMGFFLRHGDNFSTKVTVLAEYERLLKQKGYKFDSFEEIDLTNTEGKILTQATLEAEKIVNTSNKILRGELFTDRRINTTIIRNLTLAFSSHQSSLASQMNLAIRDLIELHAIGAPKSEMASKLRTIGAIVSQQLAFSSIRFYIGAASASLMIGLAKDLFDDREDKVAELYEKLERERRKGDPVKIANAENELANAKSTKKIIEKMSLTARGGNSLFTQIARDATGSFHFVANNNAVQRIIFFFPDTFAKESYEQGMKDTIKSYNIRIKQAKDHNRIKDAAALTEEKTLLEAAEYIPFAYQDSRTLGVGGLYGAMADNFNNTTGNITAASMGNKEWSWNDFVITSAALGIGQAEIKKTMNLLDKIENEEWKRAQELPEKLEKAEEDKRKKRLSSLR